MDCCDLTSGGTFNHLDLRFTIHDLPDCRGDLLVFVDVDEGGEGAGPGDIAMAIWVGGVAAFAEGPFAAGEIFAQGEVIGSDVLLGFGEALFGGGELVHEAKAEIVLFGAEVDAGEFVAETIGSFPTDLFAEAGVVAGGFEVAKFFEEVEEDGLDEVPVFGAAGEECTEPEFVVVGFVDVDGSEVALAGGSDIETEAEFGFVRKPVALLFGNVTKEVREGGAEEFADFFFAIDLAVGSEFAEAFDDLVVFEVEAFDFVINAATFDGGPFDDGSAAGNGVAHVGLLEDLFEAGAGAAVGDELVGGEGGVAGTVMVWRRPSWMASVMVTRK